MKMQLETRGRHLIRHYGPGLIGVDDEEYRGSVLITQCDVVAPWFEGALDTLTLEDFRYLLDLPDDQRHDIVLLGTGDTHRQPPLKLVAQLAAEGLALEYMDTRAACRTYAVLVNEYRQVAAALLPISH